VKPETGSKGDCLRGEDFELKSHCQVVKFEGTGRLLSKCWRMR
jgi:hypothetical protein